MNLKKLHENRTITIYSIYEKQYKIQNVQENFRTKIIFLFSRSNLVAKLFTFFDIIFCITSISSLQFIYHLGNLEFSADLQVSEAGVCGLVFNKSVKRVASLGPRAGVFNTEQFSEHSFAQQFFEKIFP